MLSKESLEAFKKQYKEEYGKELSDEEALAIALFEYAISNTQKFISVLKTEFGETDSDKEWRLVEDVTSYFLSLIFIYLGYDKKFDKLRLMVLGEYEKFIKTHSGTEDKKQNEVFYQFLLDKLHRNIMWLSSPFGKIAIVDKIASGISHNISHPEYEYKQIVEKLVYDIELSMYHFGIISETTDTRKLFY